MNNYDSDDDFIICRMCKENVDVELIHPNNLCDLCTIGINDVDNLIAKPIKWVQTARNGYDYEQETVWMRKVRLQKQKQEQRTCVC